MTASAVRRSVPWLVVASIVSLSAPAVVAQEAASRRIEEVIVTAERREASIQDTSISITAFTAEFLDDFGIRNQEDLQNYVPATTIQPYDATVRGVGRNFRALGGDPGVSTYMNGVYSEDLLTATAATFFDVERIEVLRGPQGTLYGRNAVGGAINILYKEPTYDYEGMVKAIAGNFGAEEYYLALSGPIVKDKLAGRLTYAHRERDGMIEEIGDGEDLDGLGTDSFAVQLRWNPLDNVEVNMRANWMDIDRPFGGANGGGLVVLNESGNPSRVTDALVPGWRQVDPDKNPTTAPGSLFDSDFFDPNGLESRTFTDPTTGQQVLAQRIRPGIDYGDFDGFQNAAASMDGFNVTSPDSAARLNECVFPGSIDGDEVCAGTNGFNNEEFEQNGVQFNIAWDVSDKLQLKYLFGFNTLSYERITDDDNTPSRFMDRQFYVNHEAMYRSHELQAFYDIGDSWSFTSGIFFYNAKINQRGDFYDSNGGGRFSQPFNDATGLDGIIFGTGPMVGLFSAKESCFVDNPAPSCEPNNGGNNLQLSRWLGDDGSSRALDVVNGPRTESTDLLYATATKREAFAAYTQAYWTINETFSLTLGLRYAEDEIDAEENLFRYSEAAGPALDGILGGAIPGITNGLAAYNIINGGLVQDGNGNWVPTPRVTNGGIPFALSVYRPFERTDDEWGWRVNLDHQINENLMLYYSATKAHRSGGFNLVFFSNTPTYDPEELISYEIGYKSDWLDNTLQINGSFYYYDYENVHTVVQEVTTLGGLSNSVLAAPGGEVYGVEAEGTWLVTDHLTVGGNFSYTPSEYSKSLLAADLAGAERPPSLFPNQQDLIQDIKGRQLLQVPEWKATLWGSYRFNLAANSTLDLIASWAYTDEVFYSAFESESEKADSYERLDLRATWTSSNQRIVVSAFANNVFDDVAVLQVLSEEESEFFRRSAGTTVPRHYGLELSYRMGNY
jgi:outer membrane receptor protein involved in Fe transport